MRGITFGSTLFLTATLSALAGYVEDRETAVKLAKSGDRETALADFVKMGESIKDEFQQSDAFEQAAEQAIRLKQYDQAMRLAERIPLSPVSKTCQMRILAKRNDHGDIVKRFKAENIDVWPESVKGSAFFLRGMAAYHVKDAELAISDLSKAAEFLDDGATQRGEALALTYLGNAYRELVGDEEKALATYRRVRTETYDPMSSERHKINYDKLRAAMRGAIAILQKQGKHQEAINEVASLELPQSGWTRSEFLMIHADALRRAGKIAEASSKYKEALATEGIWEGTRKRCEEALAKIEGRGGK